MDTCDCYAAAIETTADPRSDIYNIIEPEESEDEYREASRKALGFIFSVIEFLSEYDDAKGLEIKFWAVASALGHSCVDGKPDLQIAKELKSTRQNFSKHLLAFELINGLPPNFGQKGVRARRSFTRAHLSATGENVSRSRTIRVGLSLLARALGHIGKASESLPVSEWPEAEADVLRTRAERLMALAEA